MVNKKDFCGNNFSDVPEGWFVYSLGQNPAFCLWECHLVRLNQAFIFETDKNNVFVEEYDTPLQAIHAAAELVRKIDGHEHI